MALNKSQTSLLAKLIISLFGIVLVIGLAGPSLAGLVGLRGCTATTTQDPQSVLDGIASQYRPVAESWEGALASDPTSTTILVTLGNLYSDWSFDVRDAIRTQGAPAGSDAQYASLAVSYYERAIEAGATQPEVGTDLAISYFYAGDVAAATAQAEEVMAANPDFAPVYYNAGIFYESASRPADALAAFERYLELDPDGLTGNPDYARERVAALSQTVSESGDATSTP